MRTFSVVKAFAGVHPALLWVVFKGPNVLSRPVYPSPRSLCVDAEVAKRVKIGATRDPRKVFFFPKTHILGQKNTQFGSTMTVVDATVVQKTEV